MSLKSKQGQQLSVRAAIITTMTAATLVGLSGPAAALPTDQVVQFVPTLTRVPGNNCSAIINAETVPQPQSGQFGVRVKITQTGQNCGAYRVAVRWKNLDSGYADGQSHRVNENGAIEAYEGGVIMGMGMGPGAGRVEARIVTLSENHHELEQMSGTARFTLG
ncbi:hypothetical protein [Nocardia cyriacigeorgica]|nr:hypothetical protein [Nocardia cyriacigeorgica]